MRLRGLLLRNLSFFWRTNLAVIAGVGTAVSVLAGALLVGESVRASLRKQVLQRLGNTDYVISASHFFREELAESLASEKDFQQSFSLACPMILLQGVLINEKTGLRAHRVNVFGIDERFWKFQNRPDLKTPGNREALLGQTLAAELSAQLHDTLLLRIEKQEEIPKESLYGRREDIGRTVRLICSGVLPVHDLGEFSLQPSESRVRTVFVPLKRIQSDLQQLSAANTILVSARDKGGDPSSLRKLLANRFTLQDLGLRIHNRGSKSAWYVESERILLDERLARAAWDVASEIGVAASGVYTYLANAIRVGNRSIPYSVISAVDLFQGSMSDVRSINAWGGASSDSIWLNAWAQRDLRASPGDVVSIDYFLWEEVGRLVTRSAEFRLAGILPIEGDVADPALAPDFPGITEKTSVADWDPPFPIDLNLIRPEDEKYWDRYKTVPKAFISLAKGQELWQTRFGKLSSIRLRLDPNDAHTIAEYQQKLRSRLDPEQSGFIVNSTKAESLEASRGSTDFGQYFVYFSSFLIAAAILLSALFFRLGVEQRIKQIGILTATGFAAPRIRDLFLIEGLLLSTLGSIAGLFGAAGYGWLVLLLLRSWWGGSPGTGELFLHSSWKPFAIGSAAGILVAVAAVALTLRGLRQNSPRAMLAGILEPRSERGRRTRILRITAVLASSLGILTLSAASIGWLPEIAGFFGAGFLLLTAVLSSIALGLRRESTKLIAGKGWPAIFRLGTRNAAYRPGRSLLCVSLIASATFVIVSVEAFRHDPEKISLEKNSGTGGYPLYAESLLPVVHDLNRLEGKEALNLSPRESAALEDVRFTLFRLRPGDDISCLNLYAPQQPRILGVPQSFITSGRFSFQDSVAQTPELKKNPWLLLESPLQEHAIPAIADANTIQYILHRRLGQDIVIRGSNGEPVRLRLVAALKNSMFQGELLISEANFLRLFPHLEGYRFFMIDIPPQRAGEVTQVLEEGLADLGFDIRATRERLASYHAVENMYLSTFQSLGGLGLVLGTVGLATVLLRNVMERRHELALLRAVGFRRKGLAGLVVAENVFLILLGLIGGTACALVAIAPALGSRGGALPLAKLAVTLGSVLIVGLGASVVAVVAAFRAPLLPALRAE